MSIAQSKVRGGNFTSSNIYKLMSDGRAKGTLGTACTTYIYEKNLERITGTSLPNETNSRETSWGKFMEQRMFNLPEISTAYTLASTTTKKHPTYDFWSGSPDGTVEVENRAIYDFKAPFTRKSFFGLVLPLYCGFEGFAAMEAVMNGFTYKGQQFAAHKDGEKYFWQLVSNAILEGVNFAELIVYMPYESELAEIYQEAKGNPTMKWMDYVTDDEIPYLPNEGVIKNLNIIRFEVTQEMKDTLTQRVEMCGKMLVERTHNHQ